MCNPCRSVVPYKTLYHHLRDYHKIRTSACKAIVSRYETLSVSQTDADVVPLPSKSSPLRFLAPPERGYFCPQCDWTTCTSTAFCLARSSAMPDVSVFTKYALHLVCLAKYLIRPYCRYMGHLCDFLIGSRARQVSTMQVSSLALALFPFFFAFAA